MSDTLLLNSDYRPISILPLSVIPWQHAIKLMFLKKVNVLETYPDWIVRSERLALNVPSVCVTTDYVVPKSNGGKTHWENCVTACKSCNHSKGDKLWRPKHMPYRPEYYSLVTKWKENVPFKVRQPSWNQYLGLESLVA